MKEREESSCLIRLFRLCSKRSMPGCIKGEGEMLRPVLAKELLAPTAHDISLAEVSSRVLAQYIKNQDARTIKVIDDVSTSEGIEIPNVAFRLLIDILAHMSRGDIITVVPIHAELTTQEAADFLNVSRPFLVKLLEEGQILHHKVGTHRRVLFKDLLEFQQNSDQAQEEKLKELTAIAQELDLGY